MSVEDDLAALPLQPITCLRNMMQKIWSHLNAASNLIGYVLLTAALHSMEDEVPVLLHLLGNTDTPIHGPIRDRMHA